MRPESSKRVTVTLDPDEYHRLEYWAKSARMSINEYLKRALEFKISWDNKDYDLSTLEAERLNQLIDAIAALSSNVHSLEGVVTSGFDSLLGLTRGDNYLLDEEEE